MPGTWKPGKYRVDCSYGGKLIARDRFEVTGDAALTKGPPDIPSLGAHVVAVKFFESEASATPPQSQRIYAERFEAQTTTPGRTGRCSREHQLCHQHRLAEPRQLEAGHVSRLHMHEGRNIASGSFEIAGGPLLPQ